MAGAGVRVFQPGEVLTAALVNTYLQDQVVCRFDNTTDRDGSFGGVGQPVLEEGRICYLDSTNELQYFDGTVWVTISPEAITGVITAKGDLVIGTAPNTVAKVAVGANGRVLTADSTTATGVAWVVPSVPDGSITEAKLNDDAVTTSKIANNAITSDKIAPGTVIAADIAAGTITVTELADGAVTSAKILDGTIVNADVNASAAIAHSKLANITAGSVLMGNATNVPTATALSGDVTVTSGGVTAIGSGVIVNADINNSAAIALSKLASGTAGQTIVVNSSGVPTYVQETGDVTIDSSGVTSITANSIVNADVNSSAAIAYSKLSLANSISETDLAVGAPRAGFRSFRNTQTGTSYTIALSDLGSLVELSNASSITLTVPTEASQPFAVGDRVDILQTGAGQVTIAGAGGVTVNAFDGGLKLNGQWAAATLIKRATNTWVAIGNLTT